MTGPVPPRKGKKRVSPHYCERCGRRIKASESIRQGLCALCKRAPPALESTAPMAFRVATPNLLEATPYSI